MLTAATAFQPVRRSTPVGLVFDVVRVRDQLAVLTGYTRQAIAQDVADILTIAEASRRVVTVAEASRGVLAVTREAWGL